MKTTTVKNISPSIIGTGCMAFSHGYGEAPEEAYSLEAIQEAYKNGCTFFDTAESYGTQQFAPGHNEKLVGKAIKDFRSDVVLATKMTFKDEIPKDEKEAEEIIRRHLDASLKNLQTDYIDLYYLHRYNPAIPMEWIAKAMGKLIQEGKIKGWGLSQVDLDTVRQADTITPLTAVQNLYNLLERDAENGLLEYLEENDILLVPFSPVASGLLSGKISKETDFSHHDDVRKFVPQLSDENIDKNQPIVDYVQAWAKKKGATPAQIALAWMVSKSDHIVPIPGSKNKKRIKENLEAADYLFDQEELKEFEKGLEDIQVYGHRGQVEFEGSSMSNWGKK